MIRQCRGSDLILLPELWNIGFMSFDRYQEEAETQEGPTLTLLRNLARELSCHLHTPGPSITVIPTEFGNFGLATCYDLRFPELFRKMLDQEADFFLVSSVWPYPRLEHWLLLNRTRALENLSCLISSNCVGINRGKQFLGHSLVVDPMGQIVRGGDDEECIVRAEIDRNIVLGARAEYPALRDRVFRT
jgi:predicted amidohydrolase